jgi:hypothetical protein
MPGKDVRQKAHGSTWVDTAMKMAVIWIVAAAFILSTSTSALTATWFVRSNTAVSGNGTSWAESFISLSEAVSAATTGDDIWMQAGTYTPASTIYVDKAVSVLGGFIGSETEASQRNFAANETVIDGGGAIRIMSISASATIDGLTLTNGSDTRSGAMVISGAGNTPTIANCKFTYNSSTRSYTVSSEGYDGGGAVWVFSATPTFSNCIFAHNTAAAYGGAVNTYSGSASFFNCTFTRNIAYQGGAIYILGYTTNKHRIYNCILWGNTGGTRPDVGIRYASSDAPEANYNCCASYYLGTVQVYTDPLIVDPGNGNYHIGPGSSCIDQGTASVSLPTVDMDGDARQLDGDANGSSIVDIGADEYDPSKVYFADYYVDGIDGSDGDDGTTWGTAKATVQAAIDAAAENDEIWVRSHTYDLAATVNVDKVLFIYGGFVGSEIQRNSRNWLANPTVINGQDAVRCMTLAAAATVNGFTFTNGSADSGGGILVSASGATILNSTVQNSYATNHGGGVYCSLTTTLSNSSILNNVADQNGGGVYTISSNTTTITNCLISGNAANRSGDGGGGGIYNDAGFSPLISNCVIRGNTTAGRGGGIHNNRGNDARIVGCTIVLNTASENGGGVYSGQYAEDTVYAQPDITNCVIANNHAANGGGIYSEEGSNSDIINCTIAGNTVSGEGAGLYVTYRYSIANVMNSILIGNVLDAGGYSDIYFYYEESIPGSSFDNLRLINNNVSALIPSWHNAGAPHKVGNMAVSPEFIDYTGPDGNPLTGGDSNYHLSETSDVLDVGVVAHAPFSLIAPTDDLEGTMRPQGIGYDLGAYERSVSTPAYALSASVFGGFGTVSPTTGIYYENISVPLTAIPDAGYQVASWSGTDNDASTATTNTVTMNSDKTVTVQFESIPVVQYTLTVVQSGNGSIDPAVGDHLYNDGSAVSLTASPATGWRVASWSGTDNDASTATTNTVTMNSDKTVTVQFESIPVVQYTLTVVQSGNGSIDPAVGDHLYNDGSAVSLTASPATGWRVASWSGTDNDASTATTNTVTMNSDKTVTVQFESIPVVQYTLTVVQIGSGTVSPAAGNHAYDEGTEVSLTAIANPGWVFDGWAGEVSDPDASDTSIIMDADKEVTAEFLKGAAAMPWLHLLLE